MKLTRRHFLKASAAGFGASVVSLGLSGCMFSSGDSNSPEIEFNHGVASGDPLADSLIIWTRVTPIEQAVDSVEVNWEASTDADFTSVIRNGSTQLTSDTDFTLKVDLQGLEPNTRYYYRFSSNNTFSATGQGKTLPVGEVSSVKFAVFSCANYPAGYFHVYGEASKRDDIDAVVHLGDYIYEYGVGGYASQDAEALGRLLPDDNATETISLEDYRKRYALYRTDTQLQALHQRVPFITVWDDHEITNDTWRSGAQNHDDSEGDFETRKMAALKAYFEWMPIRNVDDKEVIYRQFSFGNLVDLYMLDTRVVARDEQLSYGDFDLTSPSGQAGFFSAVTSSSRTLLGGTQLNWLTDNMLQSAARWQVLGQQVLMTKMMLPAEIMLTLGALEATLAAGGDTSSLLAGANALFGELATIKGRILAGDPTVTEDERLRVETTVPYNLDAWDGYSYEREILFATSVAARKNLVVLAGDTHNGWAGNLTTDSSNPVVSNAAAGVEFATASVSSPGLEDYLSLDVNDATQVAQTEQAIRLLINDLKYTNLVDRGFMTVAFTQENATAEWHYVSSIKTESYDVNTTRSNTVTVSAGDNQIS